jgi:hypothetical protein
MQYNFVPIDQLRLRLGLDSSTTTAYDDERLRLSLETALAQVERVAGRWLSPRWAAIPHPINTHQPESVVLMTDLLTLTGVQDSDGTVIPLHTVEITPDGRLTLLNGGAFRTATSGGGRPAATITGVWGYHPDPARMWRTSGDRLPFGLNNSDTSLIVMDIDGTDSLGQSPRFAAGQMIRAGDEAMRVLRTDEETSTLTVVRGVNGTIAVVHGANTPLSIYTPPADLEMLLVRWAAWLYREPDARAGSGMPPQLQREALALRRITVGA